MKIKGILVTILIGVLLLVSISGCGEPLSEGEKARDTAIEVFNIAYSETGLDYDIEAIYTEHGDGYYKYYIKSYPQTTGVLFNVSDYCLLQVTDIDDEITVGYSTELPDGKLNQAYDLFASAINGTYTKDVTDEGNGIFSIVNDGKKIYIFEIPVP